MKPVLAVYGGSFDPPHVAHALVCAYVLAAHRVDRMLVVPTARHPFDKPLVAFEHRVRMCEIALRDLRRVEISRIEEHRIGPSRTLHTLEALAQQHPQAQLRLVIGSDLLAETHAWYQFDRIAALAPPLVVQRAGHADPARADGATAPALPDINSTEIRRRLRARESVDGLLDPEVADYARAHALYR